ncbi:MAG TPA: hypothetical protein VJT75_17530 [Thermoleophilaceae bacterium]|nr:hypothetical protein [Thermoleophilaceae bacterium]
MRRASLVPELVEDAVPDRLPGAVVREPLVEATRETFLLHMPPAGRFLVRRGEPTRVQRAPGATDSDVRCFLDGPVAAAAALVRGLVPLRASTVLVRGRAVAIAGPSGAGKSALAAALALRGHPVLADAVTPVATGSAAPTVEPHRPEPVLWPDTIAELGLDPEAGRRVRPALTKRAFRIGTPASSPAPLAAVIFLRQDTRWPAPRTEPVMGSAKVARLLMAAWHRPLIAPLGLAPLRFPRLVGVASAGVFVELTRPHADVSPGELAALVEELVE